MRIALAAVTAAAALAASGAAAQVPDAIAAKGETPVLTVHAEGAQVYECKADAGGKLTWQFREPVATLMADGKTVGRHYAGPTWEHVDGSRVQGKPAGRAQGATGADIPWLKLDAVEPHGPGVLAGIATIQRINTKGGQLEGPCDAAGSTRAAPYAADYVFLRK
jgi:opacity protein-like surface antigen